MLTLLSSYLVLILLNVATAATFWPTLTLNDGNEIPRFGLGTFFAERDFDKVTQAVITAFEVGYRCVDTSEFYETEEFIGRAIENVTARGIVNREEMFIISKFDRLSNPEDVQTQIQASLKRLQLDYLDLYLIHYPYNLLTMKLFDILAIWKEMEKVKSMGWARSIGVSNFNSTHINYILAHSKVRPAVNEIEVSPSITNLDLVAYCQRERIAVIAYGPNGFAVARPFTNYSVEPFDNSPLIVKLAEKYHKTSHQIILRYLVDRSIIPIPRSGNKEHLEENIDIFDFSLSRKEVYLINEYNHNAGVYNSKNSIEVNEALVMYYYGKSVQQIYDSLGIN